MGEKLAQSRMKFLIDLLTRYNHAYYVLGNPEVSDSEYDALYCELQQLESDHPKLVLATSPTQKIVATIDTTSPLHRHVVQMLSIKTDTSYDSQVPFRFAAQIQRELKSSYSPEYIAELKYDGLAVNLVYVNGKLLRAILRGDGFEGEDVLYCVKHIATIPKTLGFEIGLLEVRGELLMTKQSLQSINARRERLGQKQYPNARNAAAGIVRTLDAEPEVYASLYFATYGVGAFTGQAHFLSQTEMFARLSAWGFPVYTEYRNCFVTSEPNQLVLWFDYIQKNRNNLPFDIDGVVYKINSIDLRNILGFNAKEPKWAIAHKFPPEAAVSTLREITLQVGRTGSITPVGKIEPVRVGGVEVSSVSLYSEKEISNKKLYVGAKVLVHRAGDVVPEIIGLAQEEPVDYVPYSIHALTGGKCPQCSSAIYKPQDAVVWRCKNGWQCGAQLVRAIEHFAARPAMNIDGLGDIMAAQLVDSGLVKGLSDLYQLTTAQLLRLPGIGSLKASQLIEALAKSLSPKEDKLLYAIGIPGVGPVGAKILLEQHGSIEGVLNNPQCLSDEAKAFVGDDFIRTHILALVEILNPVKTVKVEGPLTGCTFAITGSVPGQTKLSLEELLKSKGACVASNVTKQTTHLLCGENPGDKKRKAEKLGIPVISFDDLKQKL